MISIIIPTYQAERYIHPLMESLANQTETDKEIIIIDSSSSDNTPDIARAHGCRVVVINKEDFDHGQTRTEAAKLADGDLLVFLTQDALPADEHALENLLLPLREDQQIAAVYGRQLPGPDANLLAKHLRNFNYPDQSYIRGLSDCSKYGMKTAFFSNSFAAYKTSSLKEIGYFQDHLIFGEDTLAAARLLQAGHKIAYAAEAKVFHSHNYSITQEFRRYFDMGVFHTEQSWFLETFGKAEKQGLEYLKSSAAYLIKRKKYVLLPDLVLRILIKFLAYKTGRCHRHFPKKLNQKIGMNRHWWQTTV